MKTDFTSYWESITDGEPCLTEPGGCLIFTVEALRMMLFDAFQNGVVHHAEVTKYLRGQAAREASDKLLGPASLKPEFEEIFGRRAPGREWPNI